MDRATTFAIVLSAGLSRRMGRFKPLLPLGGCRTIERVVNFFQAAGVSEVLVVVGHRADEIRQASAGLNVRWVENPQYKNEMFASVQAGIHALPTHCRAFFVHPVDIPLVRPHTATRLMAALTDTSAPILYPAFDGRRGHPTLIRAGLGPRILEWTGSGGLKSFLAHHDADSLELPVVDEAVLLDLDTPEDYQHMLARVENEGLPSVEECRVLMDGLPPAVAAHSRAVADVARRLAEALHGAGLVIDIELVRAAALLHDIARTRENHAAAGAQLLQTNGFERLAPIVGRHMDQDVDMAHPIDAAQVVYLADKLVAGDRRVGLAQRFERKMQKVGQDPGAAAAIMRRRESARRIQAKVERVAGRPIQSITGPPGLLDSGGP